MTGAGGRGPYLPVFAFGGPAQPNQNNNKTHLVSTYAFLLEKRRPELFEKIVAIDVGGAVEPSPLGLLAIVSYHLWLIAAFRVGGRVGDAMARSFAWLVGAPNGARVATASSCYPYYHWWKRRLDKSQEQIKALVPKAPVLFLYGTAGYKSYLVR